MILKYATRAERDLEEIADWISMDNPVRAITFVAEIRAVCGKLVDYPHAFASVPGRPDTHRYLHGKYLIYYRIRRGRVTVARIVHGARNQPSF